MPSFPRGHLLICLPPSPVFRNSLGDSGAFVSGHHFGKARLHSVPKKRPTITSPPSDTRPGRVGDPSPQSWRCTSVDARAYIFVLAPRYNCRTMADWARRLGLSREALINSARTAVATVASLLLARSLKLPEFYWAPISTIVILLSTINPLTLAWQRFAGTALGAALGALIATFFSSNWIVYGAGIFVCGIVCSFLLLESAYRFAAITLSIVLLVAHERAPWIFACQRLV